MADVLGGAEGAHRHASAPRPRLTGFAWLSIAAAVVTIALKSGAYLITGSVGLLSDAMESLVNLAAAILALVVLRVAAKPADDSHHFGHGKAEYFSAFAEGVLIAIAAALIGWTAIQRLINPQPLEEIGIGLAITLVATAINGVVGLVLVRAGNRHRSLTLVADGKHLLTDVWTSVGVVVAVLLVGLTGWLVLDPLVALAVGANILVTGALLVRRATRGLMDHSLPPADVEAVLRVLRSVVAAEPEVGFHAIQTRESGHERFVSMHVLVPGGWTVTRGHDLLEQVEERIVLALPHAHVHTHLEPREDPRSYADAVAGLAVLSADGTEPGEDAGPERRS
ncbi:MAG: cation diffusion facilitator family transporter [Candidatus Nanopelagicales bacterium]